MYVGNRKFKNAYKVVRKYKTTGKVLVISCYGALIKFNVERLQANGYRFLKSKPTYFNK